MISVPLQESIKKYDEYITKTAFQLNPLTIFENWETGKFTIQPSHK